MLAWVAGRYEIAVGLKGAPRGAVGTAEEEADAADAKTLPALAVFGSLGELYAASSPKTNGEKALVAGYWLQTRGGAAELTGQAINTELKHLGHGVGNITVALDELKSSKPALALQLRKTGASQQARKKYKITEAGLKQVENMVRGEAIE